MDAPIDTKALEQIANDRADWLVDAVATSTQNRAFLRGDPEEDKVATESIFLNGKKAISVAISKACDEIDRLRTEAEPVAWRWRWRKSRFDTEWKLALAFDPDHDPEVVEQRPLYARTEADVRVKALGWGVNGADTGLGSLYYVRHYDDGTWGWHLTMGPEVPDRYSSPGEAKAAAQADYETRIRAALQGGDNA